MYIYSCSLPKIKKPGNININPSAPCICFALIFYVSLFISLYILSKHRNGGLWSCSYLSHLHCYFGTHILCICSHLPEKNISSSLKTLNFGILMRSHIFAKGQGRRNVWKRKKKKKKPLSPPFLMVFTFNPSFDISIFKPFKSHWTLELVQSYNYHCHGTQPYECRFNSKLLKINCWVWLSMIL